MPGNQSGLWGVNKGDIAMNITYTTRQGQQISVEMAEDKAIERMIWLWRDETMTVQVNCRCDSDMRFDYRREAKAIKAALSQ